MACRRVSDEPITRARVAALVNGYRGSGPLSLDALTAALVRRPTPRHTRRVARLLTTLARKGLIGRGAVTVD